MREIPDLFVVHCCEYFDAFLQATQTVTHLKRDSIHEVLSHAIWEIQILRISEN